MDDDTTNMVVDTIASSLVKMMLPADGNISNSPKTDDAATTIDIDALARSIKEMMPPPAAAAPGIKACIFKTPEILLRHNSKAYHPIGFSIGPLHHGKFPDTEQIKLKYLQGLLSRAPTPHTNLKDLIKEIAEIEDEARACYATTVTFSKEDFTKMLLLDGCFLIELLRKRYGMVSVEEDEPVLKVPSMRQCLWHDLLLLENQIPWFVLQRLHSMTTTYNFTTNDNDEEDSSLIEMVAYFFEDTFSEGVNPIINPTRPCGHILSLLRDTLILSSTSQVDFTTGDDSFHFDASTFPSATSLVEAGVKIRKLHKGEGISSSSILDIKFDKATGVLEISPFLIQDTTEATFRNLISFEQCYPGCKPVITSYLMLLDNLIDTTKDLEILRNKGIVGTCWLDAEDATRIFNGIYTDCFIAKFYYTDICKQVNAYCKRKWPRWRAVYLRNYFGTPWAIASQVLAALLLILAFLQTFFTIIN